MRVVPSRNILKILREFYEGSDKVEDGKYINEKLRSSTKDTINMNSIRNHLNATKI